MIQPIKYVGSKSGMANLIIGMMPKHDCYVEVFGGSGAVLLNKPASKIEVYNDINANIVNLFKVLRDPEMSIELARLLELTPYSRDELTNITKVLKKGEVQHNMIEWARCTFVHYNQSFGGIVMENGNPTGWSRSKMSSKSMDFINRVNSIDGFHHRLRNVLIENDDFRNIIPNYDSASTFFYLDPPYVKDTRVRENAYAYELYSHEHRELVAMLVELKGQCILSGYETPVYKPLTEIGWTTVERKTRSTSRGDGVHVERTEVLWVTSKCVPSSQELQIGMFENS